MLLWWAPVLLLLLLTRLSLRYNFQFDQTLMGLVELWRHGVDSIDPAVFDKDAFTRQVGASVLRKCVRAWHARREHRKEYAQRMVRAAGVGGQLD